MAQIEIVEDTRSLQMNWPRVERICYNSQDETFRCLCSNMQMVVLSATQVRSMMCPIMKSAKRAAKETTNEVPD